MLRHLSAVLTRKKYQTRQQIIVHMVRKASKLLQHYGRELPAESTVGVEFAMPPFISSDLQTEWKTFGRYVTNQPKENMNEQLKELSTSSMLETVCPSLSILAKVCPTLPVGTASVERSFSKMNMIKT